MTTIFSDFRQVEKDVKENAPPIVFKYRTWKDANHRRLLAEREMWFAHPFDLNDPLDVRVPMKFNYAEVEDERYFHKILASVVHARPDLANEQARLEEVYKVWEQTKTNPRILDENLKHRLENRENFNAYGVFSTSKEELKEKTWKEYGDNHTGYCLGFKTLELCRELDKKSMFGYVEYEDEPYEYSFFNEDKRSSDISRLFLKKKIWGYEDEFRFITAGIGRIVNGEPIKRAKFFSVEAVAEVILGYDISKDDEMAILSIIKEKYPMGLPIYKTKRDEFGKIAKVKLQ
jgi:hypothetical protein